MRGLLLPPSDLSATELAAWRELAGRAVDPNPMNEPAFVLAAADHLPHGREILLLVAREGDRFHGALPVRRAARHGALPIPVATSDVRRMTYLGTPLLDDRGIEAMTVMLDELAVARHRHRWSLAVFRWVGEGPTEEMIRIAAAERGAPVAVTEDFEQPFLRRRAAPPEYDAHLSKRHLSDYKRRARRLAELLGTELELVDRGADPRAVDEFIALEAAGYKLESGVAMVAHQGETDSFVQMCRQLAGEGRLHVLCLRAADRTIAMQISVRAGDGLFLIKVSHDEEYGRYDPGVQLHLRAIRHFHEALPVDWLDVCTFPDNELLLRIYPDRRRTRTLVVPVDKGLGNAATRVLPYARTARRLLRERTRAVRAPT